MAAQDEILAYQQLSEAGSVSNVITGDVMQSMLDEYKAIRMHEASITNDAASALIMNNIGDEELAPLALQDEMTDLFQYDFANRKMRVLESGVYGMTFFTNAQEGAGTADILYFLSVSDTVDGAETVFSGGFIREYNTDGSILSVSTTRQLDSTKWYGLRLRNLDGGNVTFTSIVTTTGIGGVSSNAFTTQLTRVF